MISSVIRRHVDDLLSLTRSNNAHGKDLRLAHMQRVANVPGPVN